MDELFEPFLEPLNLHGCDEDLGQAYRMDGTQENRSMRDRAGLGTALMCCDYLLPDGEILIEDTRLGDTIEALESQYAALDDGARAQLVLERIVDENRLKVYGTSLALCRLDRWSSQRQFWLVMTGRVSPQVIRGYGLQERLPSRLRGALTGAQLVADVKVMTTEQFQQLLQERRAASAPSPSP